MSALVLTLNGEERTRRYMERAEALKTLAAVEAGYRGSRQARGIRSIRRSTTRLVVRTAKGGVVSLEVR